MWRRCRTDWLRRQVPAPAPGNAISLRSSRRIAGPPVMTIDHDRLMRREFPRIEQVYTRRDTMLYALGVGLRD